MSEGSFPEGRSIYHQRRNPLLISKKKNSKIKTGYERSMKELTAEDQERRFQKKRAVRYDGQALGLWQSKGHSPHLSSVLAWLESLSQSSFSVVRRH